MSRPDERSGVTSPPSGNGSVAGLGEAFTINLGTGQGVYSYKLALPAGRAGHGARLALQYSHGSGLGAFGLGWRLPLRAIARRLDFGVPGTGTAERWRDGGEELVETPDGSYAAARESAFTRYRRSGDGWLVEERSGVVHECGLSPRGRVAEPGHPERVQEWLLERSLDTCGNAVEYGYRHEAGPHIRSPFAGPRTSCASSTRTRPDARQDARSGFLRTTALRCVAIELYLDPGTEAERRVRSWSFAYREEPACGVSLLRSVAMTSHGAAEDGSEDVRRPPVTFGYSGFDPRAARVRFMEAPDGAEPPPLDTPDTALVTLDGAPLPGVLQVTGGSQIYWQNLGDGALGPRAARRRDAGRRLVRRRRRPARGRQRLRRRGPAHQRRPAAARLLRERRRRRAGRDSSHTRKVTRPPRRGSPARCAWRTSTATASSTRSPAGPASSPSGATAAPTAGRRRRAARSRATMGPRASTSPIRACTSPT